TRLIVSRETVTNKIDNIADFVDAEEKCASKKYRGGDRDHQQHAENSLPFGQMHARLKHKFQREPANASEKERWNCEPRQQSQNRAGLEGARIFSHHYI